MFCMPCKIREFLLSLYYILNYYENIFIIIKASDDLYGDIIVGRLFRACP